MNGNSRVKNQRSKLKVSRLKSLVLLIVLALFSLLLWGCGVDASLKNSRLVNYVLGDPKTFNPLLILDAGSRDAVGLIFNGLITQNGMTAELEPELAEKWEVSEDGLRVVFTLRSGLKWSDGQPLTVDDVIFTFNDLIFNEKIPTQARDSLRIGEQQQLPKVEKLNERQIAFTTPEPFAPFVRFVGGVEIMPKHILAPTLTQVDRSGKIKFLDTWGIDTPPAKLVGSGAYTMTEYRSGERFVYKRNPNYWKHPKPLIEKVVNQIVDSSDTALLKFLSRELDVFVLNARVKDFQVLKAAEVRDKFKVYNGGPSTGQLFLSFNLNRGKDGKTQKPFVDPIKARWFNDVNFRQAVSYALDRQTMVTNLYIGLGTPQHSPISIPSPYYLSPAQGLKTYDYNPDKAKQILIAAGYRYDPNNKLQDSEGNPVRFTLLTNAGSNPVRGQVGVQVKSDLEKIGMTVDFVGIDFNILIDKLDNSREWDAIVLGFTGGIEPHGLISFWNPDGEQHLFNKVQNSDQPKDIDRKVDDWEKQLHSLMIKGGREIKEDRRKAAYAEFQQLAAEQLPVIHLVVPLSLSAVRDRIQGVRFSPIGGALWNLDDLTLLEE